MFFMNYNKDLLPKTKEDIKFINHLNINQSMKLEILFRNY